MKELDVYGIMQQVSRVDLQMIAAYEQQRLEGKTIAGVIEGYGSADHNKRMALLGRRACRIGALVCVVLLFAAMSYGSGVFVTIATSAIVACLACDAVVSHILGIVVRELDDVSEILFVLSRQLRDLGFSRGDFGVCNEAVVRASLVAYAAAILHVEKQLDLECQFACKRVENIRAWAEDVLKLRADLDGKLRIAKSFGLEFSRGSLFVEAERSMARK